MLELKPTCKVLCADKLEEGYEVGESCVLANVNTSKVVPIMKRFVEDHTEPLFFILEIPAKEDEQVEGAGRMKNVYFIDGCSTEFAMGLLDTLGNFIANDGLATFGFGGHMSNEEIIFGKYNVMTIYSTDTDSSESLLLDFGISDAGKLLTAWDTFTEDAPGECFTLENNGRTVYDIPVVFAECGMYLADRKEE